MAWMSLFVQEGSINFPNYGLNGHPKTQEVLVFGVYSNKWCAIKAKDRWWFGDDSFIMFPK